MLSDCNYDAVDIELFPDYDTRLEMEQTMSSYVSATRNSVDQVCNNYGNRLIDFCKNMGLYIIANGRCGNDITGEATCKNSSVIDYVLLSPDLFANVAEFKVHDFNPMLSDVHKPIEVCFVQNFHHTVATGNAIPVIVTDRVKSKQKPRWKPGNEVTFRDQLATSGEREITEVMHTLDRLEQSSDLVQCDVDNVVCKISNILLTSAANIGLMPPKRHKPPRRRTVPHKPWYNSDCEEGRKSFMRSKRKVRLSNTEEHCMAMKNASKAYKRALSKAYNSYQRDFQKRIRNLKSSNPRDYWNIINKKPSSSVPLNAVSSEVFVEHFKKLNASLDNADDGFVNNFNNAALNVPFTGEEIRACMKLLKNNKACGQDQILNEFLKNSAPLLEVYVKLFNIVLDSGIVPNEWCTGCITPLYKKKGDVKCPDNYRGITILSCFGKLFTSVLNKRLYKFTVENDTIGEEQAGFKKGYSTTDHAFVLKTLIDLYLNKKKRLYCCFVDYKKAFDTVPRTELWQKVIACNINGKILDVIRNMYLKAKSCVVTEGFLSDFFSCSIGVRQGENLSPLLFAIYLSDLNSFLANKYNGLSYANRLTEDYLQDGELIVYLKLYILLYADDTAILAETPGELQKALDAMHSYCDMWKLQINTDKTKIVIFSRGKIRVRPTFYLGGAKLDFTDDYLYLGVVFNYNGKFSKARKLVYDKASRAMFALLGKSRNLNLPIDIQLHLFDVLIAPILLYGCEVWSYENCELIEKLHLRYCKYLLHVNKSTCSNMVYGELGRTPLYSQMKLRTVSFWGRLISGDQHKLSASMYKLIYALDAAGVYSSPWLLYVRDIVNECGLSYAWLNQHINCDIDVFKNDIKNSIQDQFLQTWSRELFNSSKCINYRMFKSELQLENYFTLLPQALCRIFTKFRCRNHKLPIEVGTYYNIDRNQRVCTKCESDDVGDEFHYIFICKNLAKQRKKYLPAYCLKNPSSHKYCSLMSTTNEKVLVNLVKFIKIIHSSL